MELKHLWVQVHRRLLIGKAGGLFNRRVLRFLFRFWLVITIVPLFLQIFLAYWVGNDARLIPTTLRQAKNLLILTAHPDDECLFFSPAILGILDGNPETVGGLVVLSTGNNYGIGDTRKKELLGSCESLGIASSRCLTLDEADLQDNPRVWWNEESIQKIAKSYVKKWNIDAILTFDDGGVSGHINHRAVSAAVQKYAAQDANAPPTYVLTTTTLLRKYTLLADLPLTSLSFSWRILQAVFFPIRVGEGSRRGGQADPSHDAYQDKALLVNTWSRYVKTRQAFGHHLSQYSWDRNLYLVLSRYVWFNDLRKVQPKAQA